MTELMKQVRSLFSCGGLVPILSGYCGIIFRFYSRKYLKEARSVTLFCSYFSTSIKTYISFLVFFHLSMKDSKPHHFVHFYICLRNFSLIFLYNPLNTNFQIDNLSLDSSTSYSRIFLRFHEGIGSASFLSPSFLLSFWTGQMGFLELTLSPPLSSPPEYFQEISLCITDVTVIKW